ncbi:MAG: bifunctional riboflavin kinase/FAD synthetase [Alphaproteobacteria bacterium]|nr:bifunctional riboflavin kinase/FAD synthetase [Alphaproteobacteria bacterium]
MADTLADRQFTVVRNEDSAERLREAVVAIGNFDGVHLGHRAVISAALERARAAQRPAAVLTFEPHPRSFFQPDLPSFRLSSEAAKLRLLAATGLDGAILLTFDAALASLTAEEFVERILMERFGVAGAVIGFNFHFGKERRGSPEFLSEQGGIHGFSVDVVPPFMLHGQRVSSGAVRDALAQGHVAEATELLGYPWFVTGQVVHGDKRGRTLGYPTANLRLDPDCALKHGVYAVRVGVGGERYDGVANFGRRPMFDTGAVLLEIFLFDFSGDLYGAALDVAFIGWIRPEMNFDGVEELIRRMDQDSSQARHLLARAPDAFPALGVPG